MKLLVTGGYGFIGSNFIRLVAQELPDWHVVNLDSLTYAACRENLKDVDDHPLYDFVYGDIRDPGVVKKALSKLSGADAIVNFAAETHVDNSIKHPDIFVDTNITGTLNLLKAASREGCRFLQVSTDEVYGTLKESDPAFTEDNKIDPRSPYSSSKASADHFVNSWHETYGLDTIITRCSNNYGPYQFPEKLIPLAITNLMEGIKVPVYGEGLNVRDWIHVEDHCRGIISALVKGKSGEVYNIGSGNEKRNIEIVKEICTILGKDSSYEFVEDRAGHDWRYAIDYTKASKELGWSPKVDFKKGFEETVMWYMENESWWKPIKGGY
jgi:dTDP-glucose 4,6-dehydratase